MEIINVSVLRQVGARSKVKETYRMKQMLAFCLPLPSESNEKPEFLDPAVSKYLLQ